MKINRGEVIFQKCFHTGRKAIKNIYDVLIIFVAYAINDIVTQKNRRCVIVNVCIIHRSRSVYKLDLNSRDKTP